MYSVLRSVFELHLTAIEIILRLQASFDSSLVVSTLKVFNLFTSAQS